MAAEIEVVLRYCLFDLIYESTERRSVTKQKGKKTLTLSGTLKNVFSGKLLGLVQEETLVVFNFLHTHATGDREDNVG